MWGMLVNHSVQSLLSSHLLSNIHIKLYKTIILPLVLYGCESWSPTVKEEHSLRVFDKRRPWRIFGPKREEVAGGWRRLHSEELNNLYASPNILLLLLLLSSFLGSTAQLRPWPPPQNPAEFRGGFSTIFFFTG